MTFAKRAWAFRREGGSAVYWSAAEAVEAAPALAGRDRPGTAVARLCTVKVCRSGAGSPGGAGCKWAVRGRPRTPRNGCIPCTMRGTARGSPSTAGGNLAEHTRAVWRKQVQSHSELAAF